MYLRKQGRDSMRKKRRKGNARQTWLDGSLSRYRLDSF
jgi:hypothetical protein